MPHDAVRPFDTAESTASAAGHVLSAALDAVRSPLTILSGRAQLLRRRIEHHQVLSPEDCLETLATIERHAAAIELQLRVLQDEAYLSQDPPRR
jgi:hypothetical protein